MSYINTPAVKALVADFLLTLGVTFGLLNVAPTSLRELLDLSAVIGFAVVKSGAQAAYRFVLRWASED